MILAFLWEKIVNFDAEKVPDGFRIVVGLTSIGLLFEPDCRLVQEFVDQPSAEGHDHAAFLLGEVIKLVHGPFQF